MRKFREPVISAILTSLCVILPMAFHAVPNAGNVFLPMHIPVLLCSLIVSWPYALFTGLFGPLFSSLLTGMPPSAILPSMMVELATYALVGALLIKRVRTKNLYADIYISLLCAMLAGRIVSGLFKALIFSRGKITLAAWATSSFLTGLPGLAIQLVVIPAIYTALLRSRLIKKRY